MLTVKYVPACRGEARPPPMLTHGQTHKNAHSLNAATDGLSTGHGYADTASIRCDLWLDVHRPVDRSNRHTTMRNKYATSVNYSIQTIKTIKINKNHKRNATLNHDGRVTSLNFTI